MNTKEVLNSLPAKYKSHLDYLKSELSKAQTDTEKAKMTGRIQGYCQALLDSEIVSQLQFRLLRGYYTL